MNRSRYTEEQISYGLREAESGTPVSDVCRLLGVTESSFYVWKKEYSQFVQRPKGGERTVHLLVVDIRS